MQFCNAPKQSWTYADRQMGRWMDKRTDGEIDVGKRAHATPTLACTRIDKAMRKMLRKTAGGFAFLRSRVALVL